MSIDEPSIRMVKTDKNFGVVIFSENQINDVQRFCCSGKTVLGVDKTFNLGEVFVTASTFKNLALMNPLSDDHPIFLGPMYLHGSSTFDAYHPFFSCLAASLRGTDTSNLVIGTDDETALRQAISFNFPNAKNVLCTRHLHNNFDDYLKNSVGLKKTERSEFLNKYIFGPSGLLAADDSLIFDERADSIEQLIERKFPPFKKYFRSRVIPLLKENVFRVAKNSNVTMDWANNNCESVNHVLKELIDWKPQAAHQLVTTLIQHTKAQYKDCERSLIGRGEYRLHSNFAHFALKPSVYVSKLPEERQKIFNRFMKSQGKSAKNVVASSDGLLKILTTPSCGKKTNQTKRKRAERTTTLKSKRS